MPTVLLLRHGRSTANAAGILAGRAEGVELDETGREQAAEAGRRLGDVPVVRVVSSPVERCRQTAAAVVQAAGLAVEVEVDEGLTECDYGDWTGRKLSELAQEGTWKTVQDTPSAVQFPSGETMLGMRDRTVDAVREIDLATKEAYGDHAVVLVVSHGDPIKAVVSGVLEQPFDHFQRIVVDPASITVVHYGTERPFLVALNTLSGPVAAHVPKAPITDAAVGGGSGTHKEESR